jgi:hypothetical protein
MLLLLLLVVPRRMWMEQVLQPLNEKAASIIAEHIDLLDAQHVVPELLQLVAHVSAMRVILARCAVQQQQQQ